MCMRVCVYVRVQLLRDDEDPTHVLLGKCTHCARDQVTDGAHGDYGNARIVHKTKSVRPRTVIGNARIVHETKSLRAQGDAGNARATTRNGTGSIASPTRVSGLIRQRASGATAIMCRDIEDTHPRYSPYSPDSPYSRCAQLKIGQ